MLADVWPALVAAAFNPCNRDLGRIMTHERLALALLLAMPRTSGSLG